MLMSNDLLGVLSHSRRPLLLGVFLTCFALRAYSAPMEFVEDFSGPGLDAAWTQAGNPASHPGVIAGTYDLTHANGDPAGGTKLRRTTSGSVSAYTHEIELVLDPHLLGGGSGTQTDFKWKAIGSDGILEVVYNSFGDLRVNHLDFNTNNGGHVAGGSPDNINIGYADGDLLKFSTVYDPDTDTVDVSYSINGGATENVYSGTGIDGALGDVITSSVEVEIFKFGNLVPDQTIAKIDHWSLAAVIQPTGDYNGNGVVDAADYTLWRDTLGQSVPQGTGADGSNNGLIDQADYDFWAQQYGTAVATSQTIPEPGALVLGVLGLTCVGLRSRQA